MRIANKFLSKQVAIGTGAALLTLLGGLPFYSAMGARAADAPLALVEPPAAAPVAAPSAAAAPAAPAVTPPAAEPVKTPGAEMNKSLSTMEEKVSENAKNVVKRLDTASDNVMLEDLNSARQTVARIEAMIDIEKHMAELDKLRNERSGHAAAPPPAAMSLANALPASALQPLPLQTNNMPMGVPTHEHEVHRFGGGSISGMEISRITGVDGKYTALLKLANGETKSVKVGEHISGDSTVRSINSSSVEIEENGETHTLHIKNVDAVYSAMR